LRNDRLCALILALALFVTSGASGLVPKEPGSIEAFHHPDILVQTAYEPATALVGTLAAGRLADLAPLGVSAEGAFLDTLGGRWSTLIPATPLIPGRGVGNELRWEQFAGAVPRRAADVENAAWSAFVGYVRDHTGSLRIDPSELAPRGKVTSLAGGELVQIYVPRVHRGIPVRDSSLTATINNGNLVLFGATRWGDITTLIEPRVTAAQAFGELSVAVDQPVLFNRKAPFLNLVPALGKSGYAYRLAWVLTPEIRGDSGRWEALIDAHTGELLQLQDLNQYGTSTRRVQGGVLPVSNDGLPPDGVEQTGWPMSWTDVTVDGATTFTDAGGNLGSCATGTMTTTLSGQFMRMADVCGPINESSAGNVDLGSGPGTDCTVPAGHSAGDTHASRSGFFEINQVKALARGHLPANFWLQGQLTANMNINMTCNANWDGSAVNFYRSGGGCNNTGELAGVYDHEWGHGMDNNDNNPSISNPGEGVADIYAALRLNTSCMGRNFRATNCGGYGDPCTDCTGVRDIDWANRASGIPHDISSAFPTGIDALCGSGGGTPCGGSTHCEGAVYAEAVWDLFNRDLPGAGFDHVTSIELATRLTFGGATNVGNWFTCTANFGGCNADGGYLNYLAAAGRSRAARCGPRRASTAGCRRRR
jgi:hypothetical protein